MKCTSRPTKLLSNPNLVTLTLLALTLVLSAIAAPAQTIIHQLDDPNAGTASGQGTAAVAINTGGTITGGYVDKNNVGHGFVRSASGVATPPPAPHRSKPPTLPSMLQAESSLPPAGTSIRLA
jgi:hypothetical protein